MRHLSALFLFITLGAIHFLNAVPSFSPPRDRLEKTIHADSLHISLLTVAPGIDAYERFGHTAIRAYSRPDSLDIIYHYGVFNFHAPHFIYRFVKGETDYQLGIVPTWLFIREHEMRGLAVLEQELALAPSHKLDILERLTINYQPKNRTYRYNFFFDNCATRPFRLIDNATGEAITYNEANAHRLTLRDMLKEKTGENTWLDFGISLVVTGRADCPASFREQMFLPDYLSDAYAHASIAGNDSTNIRQALVKGSRYLVNGNPEIEQEILRRNLFTSPLFCFWALFVIVALLSVWQIRRGKHFYLIDTLLLLTTGAAGILVWFLTFFSEHPAVDGNWNCLWLWPTHLLFAFLIWIKKYKKAVDFYFFLNFAAILVYLICAPFNRQHVNAAFFPLIFTLALRAFLLSRLLSERFRQKITTR